MNEPACQGCHDRDAELALLRQQVAELQAAVRDLQARLNTTSANSSTPPSADPLDAPARPAKKPSRNKRGAQPGHQAFARTRLPPDRVTRVVVHAPTRCARCRSPLPALPGPADPEPSWHQVIDLPPVVATVVEHQGHTRVRAR